MNRLLNVLPYLASQACQERYINRPDAKNYLLPEQVLDDVQNALEVSLKDRAFVSSLTAEQHSCLASLLTMVRDENLKLDFEDPAVLSSLVYRNPQWNAVRKQAALCLNLLQFDLTKWERESIN